MDYGNSTFSILAHGSFICFLLSMPQVCSVLESLEQEYKREEDWCGGADKLGPNSESDHVTPMISKHLEQKEAFLKVTKITLFKCFLNHIFIFKVSARSDTCSSFCTYTGLYVSQT